MSNITPVENLKKNLNLLAPEFKKALPPHVSVDKFVRTLVTAVQTTPALLKVNPRSLYAAAVKCASSGLMPDGKEAALVPYGEQVQYIPMIAGLLKQLRNSGDLASITANLVFEQDHFKYWVDHDGEHLEHEPVLFGDAGQQLGVYAMAKLKDGTVYVEVMSNKQIEDVRQVSKAKNGPAWSGAFKSEMMKKSALRRLFKRLPSSADKAPALDSENDQFDFEHSTPVAPTKEVSPKDPSRPSRLKQMIAADDDAPDLEVEVIETTEEEVGKPELPPDE